MASQASLSLAQSLYVAYYGRPADPDGLEFWATVLDDNSVDINVMLTDFGNAPEYTNRFGNLTNEQLVNNLYLQMFGRSAEPEGRDFWVGVLSRGDRNLAEIADSIRSLASPNDKQVLDARVKLADAFTAQLDTNAELQAYGTDRGLNIGRDYLNQVNSTNATNPPIDQVVDVVATLLPDNGGGTPAPGGGGIGGGGGGGGVTPPPAKTLLLNITDDVLTFGGTATGDITVSEAAGELTFTRDGITATQSQADFDALESIDVGSAAVTIAGELLSGQTVAGTGTVTITGVVALADLEHAADGGATLVYTTVSGSSDDLAANDAGLLTTGVNVIVTDASVTIADLAALTTLQAVIAPGTITAADIEDSIANLVSGSPAAASQYINAGANVIVTDAVTVEQIAAIDAANGDGALTYDITDSLVAVLAAEPATLVTGATSLTLTGGLILGTVTVAELNTVLGWSNLDGGSVYYDDLTYSLEDSAVNLLGANKDYVTHASAVTASEQSSIAQASELYKLYPTAVYSITASASALANPANADLKAGIDHAVDLTASNPATVAQAQVILAHNNSGATTYNLQDNYSNLSAAGLAANSAHDIKVGNPVSLTQAQAQTIVDFSNDGLTALNSIEDNAANINTFIGGNAWASESLTYTFSVRDSAANIIAALSNLDFVTGKSSEGDHSVSQVYVTDSFTTATAKQFWEAVNPEFESVNSNTAAKTTYTIIDTIAHYISDEQPDGDGTASAITAWVRDADTKVVTGSAADINLAQDQSRLIFRELDSDDSIQATGSAGNQTLFGSAGHDHLDGGADNDTIYGLGGWDNIVGGTGYNYLGGGDGRDTVYAGASAANTDSARLNDNLFNQVVGGKDGDNMFGSANKDIFIYQAGSGLDLIAETGNTVSTRDYITNFSQGDRITFAGNAKLQFLGNGSTNASSVDAGDFGLSIRYDKVANAQLWGTSATEEATRVSIDIAKADGTFDNIADAVIILVGSNIDISVEGNSIYYGA